MEFINELSEVLEAGVCVPPAYQQPTVFLRNV